ncbi:tol-pal system-associated acyl-CoA thioesterase [Yangia mangrovi]|uniref:Tol-pal system-associated acyl-CoA thioesterase n=1 Tax=Alloyangia mangrovi TaxID=1779329 RepID=A0A2A3JNQ7_9RHOB|nr:tol-pal system-associated acyl-CoA thioesterase [Alloyangia mangrovi]MCA0938409.1 tol-pal system-associated acyl-CoA thioesterase [Alloyangia pacifica]MCA0943767.1 tol-pal system-associated acyl-CoA thioesterase [Alloyangia pacifica]MCT4372993.1 tol-pal system-associated acyl-CoA thioesterase [Alloyangia mangrovi]
MAHEFPVRVYYEDTDMAGIVYHANYLKYIERARSDWVRARGIDQNALREGEGLVFVVRRLEADYLAPARFDEELVVHTEVKSVSGVRLGLTQEVQRAGKPLFRAEVTLVAITADGHPARLPAAIRQQMH